jgi:hypothetical protein
LLGAAWAVWNDNSFMTDPGLCGRDLLPMIHKNCATLAQRTWTETTTQPYDAFLKLVQVHAQTLETAKPAPWSRTFTVTVNEGGEQVVAQSDELTLYAVDPTYGRVGFAREGMLYTFEVKLAPGGMYDLTFSSEARKASVTILRKDVENAQPVSFTAPLRQYFPESCRYFTLPPLP